MENKISYHIKNLTPERLFWLLLAVTSAIKLGYLSVPNLLPQEAYHWAWGKNLDWSYFDHPPLVAYSITAFTRLFGDSVFWIRFPVWLYSIGDAVLLYLIGKRFINSTCAALGTLILFNLAPIFLIGSVIMTPDVPLIFFWLLTVFLFITAIEKGALAWWLLAGFSAGCAMLGKYPGILLFAGAFLFLLLSAKDRHWLKKPHPYCTVVPASIAFFPVIYWNSQHHWVSFLFQTSERAKEVASFRIDTILQLITAQMGVTNPVLFCCFMFAVIYVAGHAGCLRDRRYALLFSFSVVPLLVCVAISTMYFVKMNWMAPAYVTGFMLTALLFLEKWGQRAWRNWAKTALFTGIPFAIFAYLVAAVPLFSLPGNTWEGWPELGKRVSEIKTDMEKKNKTFIFGNRYKVSVEMWFYNSTQERTYAQNVLGLPALEFDYWPSADSLRGQDAVFAYADIEPFSDTHALASHFAAVTREPNLEIWYRGKLYRTFYIYRCYGYKGTMNSPQSLPL